MQQVSCPTCGAPVSFRSAASVMAVCDYCKSTLVKDADSVKSIGKMSEVLEDYSPIQINASGTVDGKSFTVVGRIQLRYPAGFWNEWYVLDEHGEGAWLSDASGQYTFTRAVDAGALHAGQLPRFEGLAPGTPLDLGKAPDGSRLVFIASDIRTAQCTGGQGELPFTVGKGYTARVADFRRGKEFLTLDYSDDGVDQSAGSPSLFRGRSVTLTEMQCQLLRDPETIKDNAGRFKGRISSLECPSCGSAIAFSPGATTHLLCPSCHAAIDASGPVAEVIAAAQRVEAVHTTVPLGAAATIAAASYTVIGVMRRAEISEQASEWTEYLLYAPQKGFIWLVETDQGWERADVLDGWPYWYRADQVGFDGTTYDKLYDYNAVVRYAAGAFNWRVELGDTNEITEFQHGPIKLAAEANDAELTWSRSTPIASKDLAQWFGKEVDANAFANAAKSAPSVAALPGGYRRAAKWMTILLLAINAIPILFSPGRALVIVILAAVGLYFPAWLLDKAAGRSANS